MNTSNTGMVAWFVSHKNAAKILLLLLIFVGISGVSGLKQEVFPPFAPSQVVITIPTQGATAGEVEDLIVRKVEESLEGLVGIQRVVAVSSSQGASVNVELTPDVNQQTLLSLIKSRVDSISSLPDFSESPTYQLPERSGPVMAVNIYGDVPLTTLYQQALKLRTEVSALEGVTFAEIQNEPEMNIYIDIKPERLQQYRLDISDISQRISQYSVNLSGGVVDTSSGRIQLRTDTMGKTVNDFKRIPIISNNAGEGVFLEEIAEIRIKPDDQYIIGEFNGQKSLTVAVNRNPSVPFAVAKEVIQAYIDEAHTRLQPKLSLLVWQDETREFTSRISLLLKNGIFGFIIICIFMGVFVDPKVAFWTALGIPISIIGAMGLIHYAQLDISLNAITLLGFLIALGMIVDDALVIGESIHHETLRSGHTAESVIAGAYHVATPATFGALTTVAAFFPLVLTEGEMGSKIGGIGVVVICCLIVSLVESKLILPAHLRKPSRFFNLGIFTSLNQLNKKATAMLLSIANNYYLPVLKKVIAMPIRSILFMLALLFGTIGMVPLGVIQVAAIPKIADFALQVTIQYHPSLSSAQQKDISVIAVNSLRDVNDQFKENFSLDYNPIKHINQQYTGNQLIIDIELEEIFGAPYDAYDVQQEWRDTLPYISGVSSISIDAGSGSGDKIAIQLSGPSLPELRKASAALQDYMNNQDDIVDIRDSELESVTEYQIQASDYAKAIGLDDTSMIQYVRRAFHGDEAQRITIGDREMRVLVRFDNQHRQSLSALDDMLITVKNANGINQYIPLMQLVNIDKNNVASEIIRIDKQRTITVYADTRANTRSAEDVVGDIEDNVLPNLFADYENLSYSIEGEAKEANKSISSLLSGVALVICVLFSLMAIPLGSFRYPALILCLIPFGIIGAFWGHFIYGTTFSLLSIFGVIALAGVIINNGLLIVDQYRSYLPLYKSVDQALREACIRRFRPIVLTSLTTFLGLVPLLWEGDPEALWLVPIAISLGFGLLMATFITLFLFPAMLMLSDRRILERSKDFAFSLQTDS